MRVAWLDARPAGGGARLPWVVRPGVCPSHGAAGRAVADAPPTAPGPAGRRGGGLQRGARAAAQQGLQLQEERLPEEVLRVLPGVHLLLRQLQVHRLQEL